MVKMLPGGKDSFMQLARLAPQIEPELARFVDEFDRISSHKKHIDLDAICKIKEIDPLHVIAVVAEAAMKFRDNASIILAALQMPKVVQRSIKTALTPGGIQDRKFLFQHSNFIPTPQGARVNVFASARASAKSESGEKDTAEGIPSFERSMHVIDAALEDE